MASVYSVKKVCVRFYKTEFSFTPEATTQLMDFDNLLITDIQLTNLLTGLELVVDTDS